MIYLKETYDTIPVTPMTLDKFIDFSTNRIIPAYSGSGAELVAAWFANCETIFQVTQLFELESLSVFADFNNNVEIENLINDIDKEIKDTINSKYSELLEPLTPMFAKTLHDSISLSKDKEINDFTLAILEVKPEYMNEFIDNLEKGAEKGIPMVTSLRPIIGDRNRITDLWRINLQIGYQTVDFYNKIGYSEEWWSKTRKAAPHERMISIYTLPYSPLR